MGRIGPVAKCLDSVRLRYHEKVRAMWSAPVAARFFLLMCPADKGQTSLRMHQGRSVVQSALACIDFVSTFS